MMAGRVSFAFPAAPCLVQEDDRPMEQSLEKEGPYAAWTEKRQLVARTESGADFRVHILNAEPMLAWMRENHPEEEASQFPFRALLNLAQYFAECLDATIPEAPAMGYTGPQDQPLPVVMFAYRNNRSVDWHYGKAMMDGSLAVVMMGREDPEVLAAIKDMRAVDQETKDAYDRREPQTVTVGKMRAAFPVPPEKEDAVGHIAFQALCPDGTLLEADFLEMPLWMIIEGEDTDKEIRQFVENAAAGYQERDVITDYEVFKAADGVYGFSARCQITEMVNGMIPVRELMRCYTAMNGIYTFKATDTEHGSAFMESIVFIEE